MDINQVIQILAMCVSSEIDEYLLHVFLCNERAEKGLLYSCTSFDINSIPAGNFRYLFRFEKEDIIVLHKALRLPFRWETVDRHTMGGIEGLCLLLRRFAYPNRLKELQNEFDLQYSSLSKLLEVICNFVYKNWKRLLSDFRENTWLTNNLLQEFADMVNAKGAPLVNCIGFIDGTARPICRPSSLQQEVFSGHKRVHCLKFQVITLPNGIILHLSHPYPGRRHDAFILRDTNIMEQLRLNCQGFCIYDDEGYPLRDQLIRPFSNVHLTVEQYLFNRRMAKVRQCVKWSFGKIIQQFAFVD